MEAWEQPWQTTGSISMELMSLQGWDGVLYSMVSHCCFQQTAYHYSIWQESKRCAFTRVKKKHPPPTLPEPTTLVVKPLHPASLLLCFLPSFSHFTFYVLVISLPLFFSAPSPAGLERGGRFNTYNNTSISESLQSGIVWHDVFHVKHNRSSALYPVTSYEKGVAVQRSLRNFGFVKVRAFILCVIEW